MANLPITIQNIQTNAPDAIYTLGLYSLFPGGDTTYDHTPIEERDAHIQNRGIEILSNLDLVKLSSSDGLNCYHNNAPAKVHFGWNYDSNNRINGLFVSIYQEQPSVRLEAFKIVKWHSESEYFDANPYGVQHFHTVELKNIREDRNFLRTLFISSIFSPQGLRAYNEEFSFNARWLDNDTVKPFFENNQQVLHNLINHSPPPQEPLNTDYKKYIYIGGAFLLLISVVYVASEYFAEDTQKPSPSMS